jgi:hypothetical protein
MQSNSLDQGHHACSKSYPYMIRLSLNGDLPSFEQKSLFETAVAHLRLSGKDTITKDLLRQFNCSEHCIAV